MILVTGRRDGRRTGRILLLNLEIFLIDKNQIFEIQDKYDSLSDVGEIRVYQRADFQSGSRVLKKVF